VRLNDHHDHGRVGFLVLREIRRRWRAAAAVGVVLGLGFVAVLTAAAGARRTETAFPRMLEATAAPHLLVSTSSEDQALRTAFYDRVRALDGVEQAGVAVGVELVPITVPKGKGTPTDACSNLSLDGVAGYEVDRPNLAEGQLPGRDRSDEVLVSQSYAETFGVGVGDELDLVIPSSGGGPPAAGEATAADGPVAHARIVGIGVLASQVVPVSDLDRAPRMMASPAFVRRYALEQDHQCYDAAGVRLARGADITRVQADIERLGAPVGEVFIQDLTANYTDVRRAIRPQVTALWLFAVTAAGATVLVVAQLLGRQLQQSTAAATPVWRALGATRPQVRSLVAAPTLVTAAVGSALALAGSLLLSERFPIGPARLAEPDRGNELHASVHVGGALVVAALALLVGVSCGFLATRTRPRPESTGRLGRIRGGTTQPAVVVGIDLAVGSRRGEAAVPVRSAVAGVSLALAAAVATVTFAGALDDLVSEPGRYGQDWDVVIDGEFAPSPVAAVLDELGEHSAVAAVAGGRYGEVTIDGQRVPTVGLSDLVGNTFPAIIEGRPPRAGDEIVAGKLTLAELGRSMGDTVTVDTGTGQRDMTIVGMVAFPRINHGSFSTLGLGTGAMTRTEAFPPYDFEGGAFPPGLDPENFLGPGGTTYEFLTVRLRPTATDEARRAVLATAARIGEANLQRVRTEQRPIAIDNYAAVRSTPVVLAVVLGCMAAATLGHLVVSVVRRRRRDLAVCGALGMRRAQVAGAVVIQALIIAATAALIGVPLGLAGGRAAWIAFASDLGVIDTIGFPLLTIGAAVLLILLVSVTVAAIPALAAARTRPGAVLRSE